jgi:hypothetical protein
MKTRIKFRKANGPAFAEGELWIGSSGSKCWITKVERFGSGKFDYSVSYKFSDGATSEKDAWPFQVRYSHISDLVAAKT